MILANKKVYDENCVYQLKDRTLVVLDGFICGSFKVSRIDAPENFWFESEIFECSSEIAYGKISDEPVELIDGEAYMFDFKGRCGVVGILKTYFKFGFEHRMFCTPQLSAEYNSAHATNIVRLVPEEK